MIGERVEKSLLDHECIELALGFESKKKTIRRK